MLVRRARSRLDVLAFQSACDPSTWAGSNLPERNTPSELAFGIPELKRRNRLTGRASEKASEDAFISLCPGDSEPRQLYKLMTGMIVSPPVALVSTVDSHGVANLAPFSFLPGVGSDPPTLLFCPKMRARSLGAGNDLRKGTLRNVKQTGEFVVNKVEQ